MSSDFTFARSSDIIHTEDPTGRVRGIQFLAKVTLSEITSFVNDDIILAVVNAEYRMFRVSLTPGIELNEVDFAELMKTPVSEPGESEEP